MPSLIKVAFCPSATCVFPSYLRFNDPLDKIGCILYNFLYKTKEVITVNRYKGGAKRVDGLTRKQAALILNYLKGLGNKRNVLLWALGITTGLRISDLLTLQLSDFLTAEGEVAKSITVNEKKTGKGRTIPVAPIARKSIDGYCEDITGDDLLFTITREQARRLVKTWCDECGLKGRYGTHTMRKTFATIAYENSGGDPVVTARVTGHSNPSQLLAYIGRKPASEMKVWNAIGKAFC
jgi:integrase